MFDLKILWVSSIVLISSSGCLCELVAPSVRVLSPGEFELVLPPEENGTLLDVRININREFGSGGPDYQKKDVRGRVIRFSGGGLNLKRGDVIYYSMTFDDGVQGLHGQDGNYIFNGVYKGRDRRRREVYEPSSEKSSEESSEESSKESSEESSEEKDVKQDNDFKQARYIRRGPHRGRFSPHGPHHHHHHYGPFHFFPPPFGVPHHSPPYPGHGSWKDRGYDHKDKFGNPWDDRDGNDCDTFGHKPKYPGGPDDRKPWHGPGEYPYPDNKNNGFDKPSGNTPGSKNDKPNVNGDGKTDNNNNNKGTEDPIAEVFTTKKTTTTPRTTVVPDIDIRFRVPEDT